jgi:hypothetical protein
VRDAGPGRGEQADLVVVEHDAVRSDDVRSEEIVLCQQACPGLAGRSNEQIFVAAPGACSGEQVRNLGGAL